MCTIMCILLRLCCFVVFVCCSTPAWSDTDVAASGGLRPAQCINKAMQPQNKERAYRQKLLAYQEAQQRQVQLVQKLQTKVARNGSHSLDTSTRMPWSFLTIRLAFVLYKVIQYKKRCGELEEQVLEKTSETEKMVLVCFYDSIRISTASV